MNAFNYVVIYLALGALTAAVYYFLLRHEGSLSRLDSPRDVFLGLFFFWPLIWMFEAHELAQRCTNRWRS